MKQLLLYAIAALLLSSCAITTPLATQLTQYSTEFNKPVNKEIGESLVDYTKAFWVKAIVITKGSKAEGATQKHIITPGEVYVQLLSSGNNEFFYPENSITKIESAYAASNYALKINAKNNNSSLVYNDGLGWLTFKLENPITFDLTTRPDHTKDSFKQELIYNGKSGSTLRFAYREYNNDFARPAFTQEIQYDINESSTIGFKGMRIEVLQATNTTITYKILTGFNS